VTWPLGWPGRESSCPERIWTSALATAQFSTRSVPVGPHTRSARRGSLPHCTGWDYTLTDRDPDYDVDPELFFPDTGQVPQVAAAKQVCAGCVVRGPCLEAALRGPQARDDHTGIFAGTTARERVRLRGRVSYAEGTRFVHDRTAAEAALALANEMSIDRAARELGVSKQALRRAFDHHGLPQPQVFQGGPKRSRFYEDRTVAEQAWRRAAEVGINQTHKELGVSDRVLRTAWQRHGLGLPPRRQPQWWALGGWTRRL
jgi:hypothetical protein